MWIRVHGIKQANYKINPYSNLWKANNKQTCETEAQNHEYMKKDLRQKHCMWNQKRNQKN